MDLENHGNRNHRLLPNPTRYPDDSDSHDGVVERSMDMSHAVRACFLTRLRARIGAFAIIQSPDYFLIGLRGPLRVRALVLVRDREPGDHDDDANRDSNQDP